MQSQIVFPIMNQGELDSIGEQLSNFIISSHGGKLLLRKMDDWVAVPINGTPDENICARIASLPNKGDLTAFRFLRQTHLPNAYRLASSQDTVLFAIGEMSVSNYALFPQDFSWLVVSFESEFFIVVGKVAEVTHVLGMDLSSSYKEFGNSFAIPDVPELVQLKKSVLQELREKYAQATGGTFVRFPEKLFGETHWPAPSTWYAIKA